MKLILDPKKTIDQNAAIYFEKAKKAKRKAAKIREILQKFKKELQQLEEQKEKEYTKLKSEITKTQTKQTTEKKWYEKFRWFISSEGILCVGGRDATTNEILVKKHLEKDDLVFHTEAPGSPFFLIKPEGKTIGEKTLQETANATITYSKAWKLGITTTEVYYVKPEQISKQAKSGEYIPKGGFMIYGKRNYVPGKVELAIGITTEGKIMAGPEEAIKTNCTKYSKIRQGKEKTTECAKKIQKIISGDLDEIIKVIPAGGCEITQNRR